MIRSKLHLICLCLLTSMLAMRCQTEADRKPEKTAWLSEHLVPLRSIEPADTNFSDLAFLKEELRDVEIIGLGEQSHGDGSTFLAKSRLIRFLREEMGFKVLAFETGMLDGALGLEAYRNGVPVDSAFRVAWFKIWSQSRQLGLLRRYVGGQPPPFALPILGFDFQFSGNLPAEQRCRAIVQFIQRYQPDLDTAEYSTVWRALTLRGRKGYDQFRKDSLLQQTVFSELAQLNGLIGQFQLQNAADSLLARGCSELKDYFYFTWNANFNNPDGKVLNIRDSVMAANVIWMKEHFFPRQKIILWAANTHLGYQRTLLKYPDEMIPMGQYLKDRYADRYYVLSFTALDGATNSLQNGVNKVPPASNKTLEYLLGETGIEFGWLRKQDLAAIPFEIPFQARPFGYTNWYADWPRMTDGIFYIKTMSPSIIDP